MPRNKSKAGRSPDFDALLSMVMTMRTRKASGSKSAEPGKIGTRPAFSIVLAASPLTSRLVLPKPRPPAEPESADAALRASVRSMMRSAGPLLAGA
jgi:hypothetical protein